MPQCPQCRGDLIEDTGNDVWIVVFSTLTTTAAGLDTDSFEIHVVLSDSTTVDKGLPDNSGVVSGDRTVYTCTYASPGTPVSGTIEVEHSSLGLLVQALDVSEMGAAA